MAERDLINKPLPLVVPEERNEQKRGIPAPLLGKLGVQVRAREVGTEADAPKVRTAGAAEDIQKGVPAPRGKGAPRPLGGKVQGGEAERAQAAVAPREAAFKAAYFNRDIGQTGAPNLRARPMAALRGEEGATDLKRVVLPAPARTQAPEPQQLHLVLSRMLPEGDTHKEGSAQSLQGLIRTLSDWTQEQGMNAQKLLQRMAELEAMVALRKEALMRMARLTPAHLHKARTLTQAIVAEGADVTASPTLMEDANALLQQNHDQADGLHGRLKKVMGIKR